MGPRAHRLEQPWGAQRVWEAGSGPTLLAIHGLGGSGRYWNTLAERVADRFHVLAPDLAGFGHSGKAGHAFDRASHLDDLDAVLAEMGGDAPVVLVGHSLGGTLAALWAARHPEATRALTLAATPFPEETPDPRWGPDPHVPGAVRAAGTLVRTAWPLVAFPLGVIRGYPPALVRDYGRQTFRSRSRTLWSTLYDPHVQNDLTDLRSLSSRVPQLLINAADDRTVPIDSQDRWSELLPNAERQVLPEGGHQFLLRTRFESLVRWLEALPNA